MAGIASTADILRAAGCRVMIASTWPSKPLGPVPDPPRAIVWHHDASPPGPSPGALSWITSSYAGQKPSAQFWVDTQGTWWLIGQGKAWHAGTVGPPYKGVADSANSVGIETDHTVGEPWPPVMLDSLRRGTAALLKAWGHGPDRLYFHKQIGYPYGRKVDPAGLDLEPERQRVGELMRGGAPAPKPTAPAPKPLGGKPSAAQVAFPLGPDGALYFGPRGGRGAVSGFEGTNLMATDLAPRVRGWIAQIQRAVGVTADGLYGDRTKAAVAAWQRRQGLDADGLVGWRSWEKMGGKK